MFRQELDELWCLLDWFTWTIVNAYRSIGPLQSLVLNEHWWLLDIQYAPLDIDESLKWFKLVHFNSWLWHLKTHGHNATQRVDLGLLFGLYFFFNFKKISEIKVWNWSQRVDLHAETFWIKIHVLNFDQDLVKTKNLKKLFQFRAPLLYVFFVYLISFNEKIKGSTVLHPISFFLKIALNIERWIWNYLPQFDLKTTLAGRGYFQAGARSFTFWGVGA